MTAPLPPPPAEIGWITDVVGAEAAYRLVAAYGGTRIHVPKEVNQGSTLALVIGLEPARRAAHAWGGDRPKIPLLRNWRARCLRAQGKTHPEIARALGVVESTVPRMLQEQQRRGLPFRSQRSTEAPHPDLFDPQTRT